MRMHELRERSNFSCIIPTAIDVDVLHGPNTTTSSTDRLPLALAINYGMTYRCHRVSKKKSIALFEHTKHTL